MRKSFSYFDEQDRREYTIDFPLVMGYEDGVPMLLINGAGQYRMSEEAFKQLAVQALRSYGYLVIAPDDIRLVSGA